MTSIEKGEKLRKVSVALACCLLLCASSMIIVFQSINNESLWKVIASTAGFTIFFIFTILVIKEFIKLQNKD